MAIDVYLQIDGIKGQSMDDKHKDWIECSSANWAIMQPRSATASTVGGHTAERAELSDIMLKKVADLSSPMLMQTCATGKTIPKAKFEFMRADGHGVKRRPKVLQDQMEVFAAEDRRRHRRQHDRRLGLSWQQGRLGIGAMNTTAAVLMLTVAVCSQASTALKHRSVFPPHLTVAEFIAQFRGNHNPHFPGSGTQYAQRYAQGYLAGVGDVSQGRDWCMPDRLKPGEADDLVVSGLAQLMSEAATRPRGSLLPYAAPFLLEQYAAKFPAVGACTFTPHLTGDDFAKHLVGELDRPGITKLEQSRDATYKQRFAEGYQAGVVDATQGRNWCAPSRMKPMEADDRVLTELDKRKASGAMPGNAAAILLELYNARFPCPKK